MHEVRLNNGKTVKLSGQSVQEYVEWRNKFISAVGQVLAVKFPEFYGRIEINLQGGHYVNANSGESIKRVSVDKELLDEITALFDRLATGNKG